VKELNINREIVKLILTDNTNMKKSLSRNGTEKCLGQASNKKKNLLRIWVTWNLGRYSDWQLNWSYGMTQDKKSILQLKNLESLTVKKGWMSISEMQTTLVSMTSKELFITSMFLQKSEPGILTYIFGMFVAMHIIKHQVSHWKSDFKSWQRHGLVNKWKTICQV